MNEIEVAMLDMAKAAKNAAKTLALATSDAKNQALISIADAILKEEQAILDANEQDLKLAQEQNLSAALCDRLKLDKARIKNMADGIRAIAALPDPVGKTLASITRPNGLMIQRVSVPIGVIAVVYESRPNVTADAAALCIKSGNAVILRGGSESFLSSLAIFKAIRFGLSQGALPIDVVQMVETKERDAVDALIQLEGWIDVLIPRGGAKLIAHLSAQSRIPLFKHLAGLCHTYVHQDADLEKANKIVLNAKMRRTGICGATETLLIDRAVYATYLPIIMQSLLQAGCEIRGDEFVQKLDLEVKPASPSDFDTEFLAPIIAIKVVENIDAAILHIAQHGTQHTDSIITENNVAANKFLREVDSAIVMHNTSTQFADGYEFGMGAEIGIATGKLHARGPVGVEQLTTFKYVVQGQGQTRP